MALLVKFIVMWLLLGSLTAVQAAVVTYTTSFTLHASVDSQTDVQYKTDSLYSFYSCDDCISKFDPALGTLTNMRFGLHNVVMTNSASARFKESDFLQISVGGLTSVHDFAFEFASPAFNWFYSDFPEREDTCRGERGAFGTAVCNTDIPEVTGLIAAHIGQDEPPDDFYIGSGTVGFAVKQRGLFYNTVVRTGGTFGTVDSRRAALSSNGAFSVSYTYSPIPVPATIWLFGSGLIGLIGIARRKERI